MSDKPRKDGSAPTRGIIQVSLKMVAADPIDFRYALSNEQVLFHFRLLSNHSALQAFIDGKQRKQTPQVLTAINVLQLIVRQAPNL
jgi:eukaryotic translation initiation factor 2C